MSEDDAIRATNDDAASCKRSAVHFGYWKDPYIEYFVRASDRKAPEINRGYFARVRGIQVLLRSFLELTKCNCQVVNLGAGFDTTYWNLKDEGLTPKNFVELDFQGVTARKTYYIKNRTPLLEKLSSEDGEVSFNQTDLHSSTYHIVGVDLRDVKDVECKLTECGIDRSLPTAFVAECVLVYMPGDSSSALLSWIAENFNTALFINYEQVNMTDIFGQVMIGNLKSRGCTLNGVEHCKSLDTQKNRFLSCGWENAEAWDMLAVYKSLPPTEVSRMEKLEFLDEREQLDKLLAHYCISRALRDALSIGLKSVTF